MPKYVYVDLETGTWGDHDALASFYLDDEGLGLIAEMSDAERVDYAARMKFGPATWFQMDKAPYPLVKK